MAGKCSLCGVFQNAGWTVENLADEAGSAEFPAAFESLIAVPMKLTDDPDHSAFQCPKCGLMYEYRKTSPGGSNDAMRTWIVEKLTPMMKHGRHLRKNLAPKPENVEASPEFICPACGSVDIDTVNAGIIGGETFVSLKCRGCGNEDTLDEWKLGNWRRRD